jgi:hypothetical protein
MISRSTISISVRISTSLPTLDLSLSSPFTITLELILCATYPITFRKQFAPLFMSRFYKGGLTFTNTRTGESVPRPTIHVCYIPSKANEPPTEENRSNRATFFPDLPYIIEATIKPTITTAPIAAWKGITVEEMKAIQAQQLLLTKWRHVGGFEDGQTYEVGICEGIALSSWLHGSFDEILEMSKAGMAPELPREPIPYKVSQSAKFFVKRPDADESLNYWGI